MAKTLMTGFIRSYNFFCFYFRRPRLVKAFRTLFAAVDDVAIQQQPPQPVIDPVIVQDVVNPSNVPPPAIDQASNVHLFVPASDVRGSKTYECEWARA